MMGVSRRLGDGGRRPDGRENWTLSREHSQQSRHARDGPYPQAGEQAGTGERTDGHAADQSDHDEREHAHRDQGETTHGGSHGR